MPTDLLTAAQALMPQIVAIRRRLHRHPELGLQLPETQEAIVEELERMGLQPRLGRATTSVTALIGDDRPGPTTILRGDMDALPLTERTGLDFASEIDGRMHACGHDTHVAMLLGGARLLVERAADLPGPVLLMFQPGEEGWFGARIMLEEGLLDGLDLAATRAFAIHISTRYPSGEIHTRRGPLLASADNFKITIRGRGGHASAPHKALDPIPVAAEIVTAFQTSLTREVDVFDPAVITVAHIEAGTTFNIIPEEARLQGTYRTLSPERREAVGALIRRVVDGVCAAHGTTGDIAFEELYPVTVNDAEVTDLVRGLAEGLVGSAAVHEMTSPEMGAEDFSYLLQRVPGAMVFLGGRAPGEDPVNYANNHSDLVVFDEPAMAVGAALYAEVGLRLVGADRA
ncbi:MAG: M20 family metallopeptidase [Chloroflexota bacterium]